MIFTDSSLLQIPRIFAQKKTIHHIPVLHNDHIESVFVTIETKIGNHLRGCIGEFRNNKDVSLNDLIYHSTRKSFQDSRFQIKIGEELQFKINFNSFPKCIYDNDNRHDNDNKKQNILNLLDESIEKGKYGLTITFKYKEDYISATYLANVLLDNIFENDWEKIIISLYKKASSLDNFQYNLIQKIEIYECIEYLEDGTLIQL